MSDEEEKLCPLCTEVMDLTDQQLKPCKCGYKICVWCWHHIMEMAEKDEAQGRCPACRTPYNKEKVVGMASKCERLVTELTVEKKLKSQKGKSKALEGRKHFESVRVIQRNLVYVVGLPLHLADEDILQRREYFGQYGKVLKVSISRTTTGAIQHFPNNTFSVYIAYSKEEEAIGCIQLVQSFSLEGRHLRACFGTSKYCHAWLRNLPCSNPDCLYLHEIGSQEDSFTKDEIVSAYTNNRVQQITGATCSSLRRSGSVLPSPTDDNSDKSAAFPVQPTSKATANAHFPALNLTTAKVSPPDTSASKFAALPSSSSWGTRSPNYQSSLMNNHANGAPDDKTRVHSDLTSFSKAATSLSQASSRVWEEVVRDGNIIVSQDPNEMERCEPTKFGSTTDGKTSVAGSSVSSLPLSHFTSSKRPTNLATNIPSSYSSYSIHSTIETGMDFVDESDRNIENLCSAISSMNVKVDQKPQYLYSDHFGNSEIGQTSERVVNTKKVQSLETTVNRGHDLTESSTSRHPENILNSPGCDSIHSEISVGKDRGSLRRYEGEAGSCTSDAGESSIISSILTSDFDPWDESFLSPQNLAKLFGEDKKQAYPGVIGSRKLRNATQSRFAFAREEDLSSKAPFGQYGENYFKQHSFVDNFGSSSSLQVEKYVDQNNLSVISGMVSDSFTGSRSQITSDKLSVSRSQMSAPPGFSVPNRLPPPGFPSFETEHIFGSTSGSPALNPYQLSNDTSNYINGDVEFIDPAILTVGKGTLPSSINSHGIDTRSSFPPQLGYEDPRLQPVTQKSPPPYDIYKIHGYTRYRHV